MFSFWRTILCAVALAGKSLASDEAPSKDGIARSQSYNIIRQPTGTLDDSPGSDLTNFIMLDGAWKLGESVDMSIGPDDAVYCKVSDPSGLVVYEAAGGCRLVVDKVEEWHAGRWELMVWADGKILPEPWEVDVTVTKTEAKPKVSTSVSHYHGQYVLLSCSVPIESEVRGCQFRDPSGRMLRVTDGATDGRYSFFEDSGTSPSTSCVLSITRPTLQDVGMWRCTIVVPEQSFYGFLNVISDQDGDYIHTVSSVSADRSLVYTAPGLQPVLSCSLNSAIRYCYFTARNGTVYSVWPGSENYVGAGFDAGECGMKLPAVRADDQLTWRCQVAPVNDTRPELNAAITLIIADQVSMSTRVVWHGHWTPLQIEGRVDGRPLEYCRFVRRDGYGFSTDNAPPGYNISLRAQAQGRCLLTVARPSTVDLHPWTVAARVEGEEGEVIGTSRGLIFTAPLYSTYITFWVIIMVTGLSLFLTGLLMVPRKHREWTYRQATSVRHSIRRSFSFTKPAPVPTEQSPPVAA